LKEQSALVDEMKARYAVERAQSPGRAHALASQLDAEKEQLIQIEQRVKSLLLKSPLDGIFNLSHARDLSDLLVARGDVIAYVTPPAGNTVRVAVSQSATEKVRHNTRRVELLQPGNAHNIYKGYLLREIPQVDSNLPHRRLGAMGGGDIAVDSREQSGLVTMEPVYQFDIGLKDTELPGYFGDRIYVRFIHPAEPVVNRWYRSIRQLLLARWNV
jgi:putative peptide zinc metalloprotease protein